MARNFPVAALLTRKLCFLAGKYFGRAETRASLKFRRLFPLPRPLRGKGKRRLNFQIRTGARSTEFTTKVVTLIKILEAIWSASNLAWLLKIFTPVSVCSDFMFQHVNVLYAYNHDMGKLKYQKGQTMSLKTLQCLEQYKSYNFVISKNTHCRISSTFSRLHSPFRFFLIAGGRALERERPELNLQWKEAWAKCRPVRRRFYDAV